MITSWTKHLKGDTEAQENFRNNVLSSRVVLERLKDILNEEERNLDQTEMDIKSYEVANWAYLQADKNGYRRALRSVKKIINLDQKETE